VKKLNIDSVIVPDEQKTLERFNEIVGKPLPRHSRDIVHLNSLIKAVTLLNAHLRIDGNHNVTATERDVDEAIKLWSSISSSMLLGIPPYVERFYKDYILPAYKERTDPDGTTIKEISAVYYRLHNSMPDATYIRKDILPTLCAASVIEELKKSDDKKVKLIRPLGDIVDDPISEVEKVMGKCEEVTDDLDDIPWLDGYGGD
jgi:hypothetical protein